MAKIGIKKIKIVEKKHVPDVFFDKSGLLDLPQVDFNDITFVQDSASLTDELTEDDNGFLHKINLTFSMRKKLSFIKSFENKPVVIMVCTVDGCKYIIGGKNTPAYITTNKNYNKLLQKSVTYLMCYRLLPFFGTN